MHALKDSNFLSKVKVKVFFLCKHKVRLAWKNQDNSDLASSIWFIEYYILVAIPQSRAVPKFLCQDSVLIPFFGSFYSRLKGPNAKAVAFDEIDKAPEEKKRGIIIATVRVAMLTAQETQKTFKGVLKILYKLWKVLAAQGLTNPC